MPLEIASAAETTVSPGELAALWNARFGATLPLDAATVEARLASPHHDPALLFVAREDGELLGAALARAAADGWGDPALGYLGLLAVRPDAAGRGLGGALWERATRALTERGAKRLVLGGEPDRLLPGVPQEAPPETWRFLRRRGVRFLDAEHDLHLDLRLPLPEPRLGGCEVRDDDPAGVRAFVAEAFPGRWAHETAAYLASGCRVLALADGGTVVGFCAVFGPDDPPLGPGLTFRGALAGPAAGLGPIGIAETRRGEGLGLGLLLAASRRLQTEGARDLIIDWTTLTRFYGRIGARSWRSYQRADAPLAER